MNFGLAMFLFGIVVGIFAESYCRASLARKGK
jgi:hypothetical protein